MNTKKGRRLEIKIKNKAIALFKALTVLLILGKKLHWGLSQRWHRNVKNALRTFQPKILYKNKHIQPERKFRRSYKKRSCTPPHSSWDQITSDPHSGIKAKVQSKTNRRRNLGQSEWLQDNRVDLDKVRCLLVETNVDILMQPQRRGRFRSVVVITCA